MSANQVARAQPLRMRTVPWSQFSRRLVALAFWVLVPIFCVFTFIFGADKLARHLNNIPPGTLGTYTVTAHSCSGEVCVTGGTFRSADGRLVERNLLGVYSWQNGEKHKAIYDSESVDVIPLPAHWDPSATFVGMAGSLGFIVLWSWCLFGAIRRRVDSTDSSEEAAGNADVADALD